MAPEENKALVRRLSDAFNDQDLGAFDEILSPELSQEWKDALPGIYQTFAGHHIDITDLIAEHDKVVARVATRGSHSGEFEGVPATGKQWKNVGVFFIRVENGKVAELETLFDVLGHLKHLGATITPPATT